MTIPFFQACLVAASCFGADGPPAKQPSAYELKSAVKEREHDLARAECELAEARARLAMAENDRKRAATEIRKAIAYHEGRLEWTKANIGLICVIEPLMAPEWDLAKANAWLAEVEGRTEDLVRELAKIVVFQEKQVAEARRAVELKQVPEQAIADVEAELGEARKRLKAAQEKTKDNPNDKQKNSSLQREPVEYPSALNTLAIGSSQEGALAYLLNEGGRRLEVVSRSEADLEAKKPYDCVYGIRLGNRSEDTWAPGQIFLYSKKGYLVAKCIVPDKGKVDAEEIYRREIASGLQHPLNYPGLLDKVHWGKATEPRFEWFRPNGADGKPDRKREDKPVLPKLRCGIALEGLPGRSPKSPNGVILLQNVGPVAMDENIAESSFPIGPAWLVYAKRNEPKSSRGFPLPGFGVYASGVVNLRFDEKDIHPKRVGRFRLEPGEATYLWFGLHDIGSYDSIQAELAGLWGVDADSARIWWEIKSGVVPVKAKR